MNRLRALIFSLVRRPGAEDLLLLSLLAFALSVIVTRLLLWLTGYPQLGSETLHISHVLWGGLFLFTAALLPLIFANHSVYHLTAILAGLGVGLFIDEVGKFVTQSYDYFFPFAAPIIYAFFLVCVLVFMQVSKPRSRKARVELYAALEYLEQVLERDLDPHERRLLAEHLETAAHQSQEPELAQLARLLLDFVRSDSILEVPPSHNHLDNLRVKFHNWQSGFYSKPGAQVAAVVGLGILGLVCFLASIWLAIIQIQQVEFNRGLFASLNTGSPYSYWIFTLAFFMGITGLSLIVGSLSLTINHRQTALQLSEKPASDPSLSRGLRWSYTALLIQLTILDLLLFYYLQFGTIVLVVLQFALLQAVIHFQRAV